VISWAEQNHSPETVKALRDALAAGSAIRWYATPWNGGEFFFLTEDRQCLLATIPVNPWQINQIINGAW
jgi:hypothetical protein